MTAATKSQLRQEIKELRAIGAQMANLCFNLEQGSGPISGANRDVMDGLRRQWDAIQRSEATR